MGIAPAAAQVLTTIEGQRTVYPRPDDNKAKIIGMANDLLRLSSRSQARCRGALVCPRSTAAAFYLPARMEGARPQKPTMHADLADRLGDNIPTRLIVFKPGGKRSVDRTMRATDLPGLPASMGHALDALCLAEFGLDRYREERWDYRW